MAAALSGYYPALPREFLFSLSTDYLFAGSKLCLVDVMGLTGARGGSQVREVIVEKEAQLSDCARGLYQSTKCEKKFWMRGRGVHASPAYLLSL